MRFFGPAFDTVVLYPESKSSLLLILYHLTKIQSIHRSSRYTTFHLPMNYYLEGRTCRNELRKPKLRAKFSSKRMLSFNVRLMVIGTEEMANGQVSSCGDYDQNKRESGEAHVGEKTMAGCNFTSQRCWCANESLNQSYPNFNKKNQVGSTRRFFKLSYIHSYREKLWSFRICKCSSPYL